ncbi:excinuclease ABC subunit UvrA [Halanaerobium congolense]|jgi:excinuclease ABC subunit A|uniref:UvrABC system protein A n=1 Tax=Halanaerobium congolense TaxID=54121 RepID=A0A1G6RS47_9FIRM|nr:excinuclease ABC subunit UvrA [Halanaerobium congolense]KXS48235.1 MAG: excinuclease ABC subunit A [Halanaerobium sp. T82-1]PTX15755.1 excinuclease ABC subunit A [Halanaerobium congolense]PXV61838.1 excinuclease ABC subunit A [Halanaerobium congolense]TDP18304.1 excinuclease ABC subunit A [Halanaerobium congolense]TDS34031.1 excinuclease ABC subunit A [Halanaerobium congolense]
MGLERLIVKGAEEHNLKKVDIDIPRDKLIVITGLSGSGKSSLAFDTIYAEGQRRYVESLSAYARQFLGQMEKPKVEYIEGLSPAISIDQKTTSRNPRSTVGTVTEIHDYLRLLYARVGIPHCPICGKEIKSQTVDEIVDQVLELPERTKIQILAPIVRGRKGEHERTFLQAQRDGFVRARVDGETILLEEAEKLDKNFKHDIEIIVDRLVVKDGIRERLADSVETALEYAEGLVMIDQIDGEITTYSEKFACPEHNISLEEMSPRMFSFNSPYGACDNCDGLGVKKEFDPDLILDKEKSIADGGIIPWASSSSRYYPALLEAMAEEYDFSLETKIENLDDQILEKLLYGDNKKITFPYTNRYGKTRDHTTRFKGITGYLTERMDKSDSPGTHKRMERYMNEIPCHVCHGQRLKPEVLAVTVGGISIAKFSSFTIKEAHEFIAGVELDDRRTKIGKEILKEVRERLRFLLDVGLDYLSLDRSAGTLSGGEAQRIRLATQIGSGLMGVLYILDEPSIGLHQRDNNRLISTLEHIRDLGNTVIVVEHDEDTIRSADYIIDMGPGAGKHGGEIVAEGSLADIIEEERSLTGQYLSGKKKIQVPADRYPAGEKWLSIKGARQHNLKSIDVDFPLGTFTCVTGVSGSGKSTLINNTLKRKMMRELHDSTLHPGEHDEVQGMDQIDKVINIDQSPIGRTPRSNAVTYTKVFNYIRDVFASTPEAKQRGYEIGRFSFNVKGGRCEACKGQGIEEIEMHFLPDVYVPCDVCNGKRYNRETLEIKYKGKTIADVLDMTVEEAVEFFENIEPIRRRLQTLYDVGLGYIRLGQPATTFSGGEAQRIKISKELGKRSTGETLYLLDEPTTGLHFADIKKLLEVLHRLREDGNTVIVIEHNLDVIKSADYLIDLGPEGGEKGGEVVATGTPEEVAQNENSYTGKFLKEVL